MKDSLPKKAAPKQINNQYLAKVYIHVFPQRILIFFLLPFFLLFLLLFLVVEAHYLQADIAKNSFAAYPYPLPSPAPYPILLEKSPGMMVQEAASVSARSALIIDDASKIILYQQNAHILLPMASTTKIMTALTALDYFKPDDVLVVQDVSVDGVRVGFTPGETVYFHDMLYAMLLPSGNDAAQIIAQNYPGGVPVFVSKMNDKARFQHLNYTVFSDPTGLSPENRTTAYELAQLTSLALQNSTFAAVVGTKQKTITTINTHRKYTLANLNRLLGNDGVEGVKTGFTDEAGQVLVTSRIENGRRHILVVMQSQDRFADTSLLLSVIDNKISYLEL